MSEFEENIINDEELQEVSGGTAELHRQQSR